MRCSSLLALTAAVARAWYMSQTQGTSMTYIVVAPPS